MLRKRRHLFLQNTNLAKVGGAIAWQKSMLFYVPGLSNIAMICTGPIQMNAEDMKSNALRQVSCQMSNPSYDKMHVQDWSGALVKNSGKNTTHVVPLVYGWCGSG